MDNKLNIGTSSAMNVKASKVPTAEKKPVKKTVGDLRTGK